MDTKQYHSTLDHGLTNYELQAKSSLPLILIQPESYGQYYILNGYSLKGYSSKEG